MLHQEIDSVDQYCSLSSASGVSISEDMKEKSSSADATENLNAPRGPARHSSDLKEESAKIHLPKKPSTYDVVWGPPEVERLPLAPAANFPRFPRSHRGRRREL